MKLRIFNDSVRFRITLDELAELASGQALVSRTHLPDTAGAAQEFRYAVECDAAAPASRIESQPLALIFHLSSTDLQTLLAPESEGVDLEAELRDAAGRAHRLTACVEKDLPPRRGAPRRQSTAPDASPA